MNRAKFKIGDHVHCFRKNDFDFTGHVIQINNAGTIQEPEFEYAVSNAPQLGHTHYRLLNL